MIHEIPCPGIVNDKGPRRCNADLMARVSMVARPETPGPLRILCAVCSQHILVTLEWARLPVIVEYQAFSEVA